MKAPFVPRKLVVNTILINIVGNIILWVAAVAYRIFNGDSMQAVNVNAGCMKVGYALLMINAAAFLIMLFNSVRSRQWIWLVASILSLLLLAYEAIFIWGIYGIALMALMDK